VRPRFAIAQGKIMIRILVGLLIGVAVAAGCSSPTSRVDLAPRDRAWLDAGTPATSVAVERVARY
jgi:hypothetical protein